MLINLSLFQLSNIKGIRLIIDIFLYLFSIYTVGLSSAQSVEKYDVSLITKLKTVIIARLPSIREIQHSRVCFISYAANRQVIFEFTASFPPSCHLDLNTNSRLQIYKGTHNFFHMQHFSPQHCHASSPNTFIAQKHHITQYAARVEKITLTLSVLSLCMLMRDSETEG